MISNYFPYENYYVTDILDDGIVFHQTFIKNLAVWIWYIMYAKQRTIMLVRK